jgi:uncharacterized membrane protein YgdD (TMEM256/DUF423 family)
MDGVAWVRVGAIAGFLAVAFGAFGAHGLRGSLSPALTGSPEAASFAQRRLENYETASRYNLVHALAIVAVGLLGLSGRSGVALCVAGWAFLGGTVVFSGTLYAYGLTGLKWLGAVTPFGGVALLVGWIALAFAAGGAPKSP